jgi:drug/metabolite transporter (DMT)-like permease
VASPAIEIRTPAVSPVAWKVGIALAAVWVIWGSTYLAIRIGLETLPPFSMQAIRFSVATLVLGAGVRVRGAAWPTWRQARNAGSIGVMLLIGGVGMVTLAEHRGVSSGLAATLIAVQPMMASVWAAMWGLRPRRAEWAGMLLGVVGVGVLVVGGDGVEGSRSGIALVLVACASWSFGSILSRRIDMPVGAMATVCEMGAAAIGFVVLAVARGEELSRPSLRSASALAYLALVGSVVAFSAFVYLMANVRPALFLSYAYVNPLIAVVLGALIGDEAVGANLLVALPIILAGIVIVTSASRERQPATALPGEPA